MEKAENLSFPAVPGSGGRRQSLHDEIVGDTLTLTLRSIVALILEVLVRNFIEVSKMSDLKTISTKVLQTPPTWVPPPTITIANSHHCPSRFRQSSGNDSQRYRDGSPQLFSRRNRQVAADSTGKHRHNVLTTCRAFT